mgnify:CR=1 FL=1
MEKVLAFVLMWGVLWLIWTLIEKGILNLSVLSWILMITAILVVIGVIGAILMLVWSFFDDFR